MSTETDIEALRIENTRLIKLLELHGIDWRLQEKIEVEPEPIRFVEAEPVSWKGTLQQYAGRAPP